VTQEASAGRACYTVTLPITFNPQNTIPTVTYSGFRLVNSVDCTGRFRQMRFQSLVLGCLTALSITLSTNALQESEVGIVDWHKSLIGVPLSGSLSTAPVFHRVNVGVETKSVVITATGSNVLAALNPVNGSVGTSCNICWHMYTLRSCCSLETCFRGHRSNSGIQEEQRR
jgi:hypothetical protein